jgi:hypothetical protein
MLQHTCHSTNAACFMCRKTTKPDRCALAFPGSALATISRPSQRFEVSGNAVWAAGLALPVMSVVLGHSYLRVFHVNDDIAQLWLF